MSDNLSPKLESFAEISGCTALPSMTQIVEMSVDAGGRVLSG